MTVLVTGSEGFIGKNLLTRLTENSIDYVTFNSRQSTGDLAELVKNVDFIFHLAGVNRPLEPSEFMKHNQGLTTVLCDAIRSFGQPIPVVFTSSIQAEVDNAYGLSKKGSEEALLELNRLTKSPIYLYRLPNVFGKWARPNYNSVVATFCYNVSQNMPIRVDDVTRVISLVYIDDVIDQFISLRKSLRGSFLS